MAGLRGPPEYPMKLACMARGSHGLPKVSPGPAMPDPSTPSGWATPEMAILGVANTGGEGGGPAAIFYPLGYPLPYGPAMKYAPHIGVKWSWDF